MKIAAVVHFAMPWRNAGSETVAHHMMRILVEAGHDVRCWVTDVPGVGPTMFEGVELIPVRNVMVGVTAARNWRPDVFLSHHQNASMTQRFARGIGARSIYLTHNDMDINMIPLRFQPDLVVHNSHWVRESLQRYEIKGQQIVVHPPLDCARHSVYPSLEHRNRVTLINVNEHKGGKILFALAARMPDVGFMGVVGGHGIQLKPPRGLPNLRMVPHSPELKPVWSDTRVLIMPSVYESYGLVGIEAGCSGIPTIANETPGLLESLGDAGRFITVRDDLDRWEAAVRHLMDNTAAYSIASAQAHANSVAKCEQTEADMARFVAAVEDLPNQPPVFPSRTTRRMGLVT